jgi:hypothetical protein
MPIDASIPLQVKQIELPNPLAQYAQMSQIQSAQNQNALAQYQLGAAQRAEKTQNVLSEGYQQGYDPVTGKIDYPKVLNYMAQHGGGAQIPAFQEAMSKREKANLEVSKLQVETAKAKQSKIAQAWRDISGRPSNANIIAHLEDIIDSPLYDTAEKAAVQKRADELLALPFDQRGALLASTGATAGELKPHITSVSRGGATDVIQTPAFGGAPVTTGTYPDVPLPPDVFAQKLKTAGAGATRVNVPVSVTTEKTYGSKFAGNMADTDINKMTAAEQAPALAASANRIIDIVNKGNVFTGPAADVKLNIARALNIAGADTNEQIANTEALIAATGTSTLAAIKGAGLGTGQGFTDKDLKFLQGVAGGTVQLTAKTLTDLAELQHRAAVRSAEAWNTRVKQIPKSALEGTGVPTEPTSVPPLSKRAGPATGSVDTNNKYLR